MFQSEPSKKQNSDSRKSSKETSKADSKSRFDKSSAVSSEKIQVVVKVGGNTKADVLERDHPRETGLAKKDSVKVEENKVEKFDEIKEKEKVMPIKNSVEIKDTKEEMGKKKQKTNIDILSSESDVCLDWTDDENALDLETDQKRNAADRFSVSETGLLEKYIVLDMVDESESDTGSVCKERSGKNTCPLSTGSVNNNKASETASGKDAPVASKTELEETSADKTQISSCILSPEVADGTYINISGSSDLEKKSDRLTVCNESESSDKDVDTTLTLETDVNSGSLPNNLAESTSKGKEKSEFASDNKHNNVNKIVTSSQSMPLLEENRTAKIECNSKVSTYPILEKEDICKASFFVQDDVGQKKDISIQNDKKSKTSPQALEDKVDDPENRIEENVEPSHDLNNNSADSETLKHSPFDSENAINDNSQSVHCPKIEEKILVEQTPPERHSAKIETGHAVKQKEDLQLHQNKGQRGQDDRQCSLHTKDKSYTENKKINDKMTSPLFQEQHNEQPSHITTSNQDFLCTENIQQSQNNKLDTNETGEDKNKTALFKIQEAVTEHFDEKDSSKASIEKKKALEKPVEKKESTSCSFSKALSAKKISSSLDDNAVFEVKDIFAPDSEGVCSSPVNDKLIFESNVEIEQKVECSEGAVKEAYNNTVIEESDKMKVVVCETPIHKTETAEESLQTKNSVSSAVMKINTSCNAASTCTSVSNAVQGDPASVNMYTGMPHFLPSPVYHSGLPYIAGSQAWNTNPWNYASQWNFHNAYAYSPYSSLPQRFGPWFSTSGAHPSTSNSQMPVFSSNFQTRPPSVGYQSNGQYSPAFLNYMLGRATSPNMASVPPWVMSGENMGPFMANRSSNFYCVTSVQLLSDSLEADARQPKKKKAKHSEKNCTPSETCSLTDLAICDIPLPSDNLNKNPPKTLQKLCRLKLEGETIKTNVKDQRFSKEIQQQTDVGKQHIETQAMIDSKNLSDLESCNIFEQQGQETVKSLQTELNKTKTSHEIPLVKTNSDVKEKAPNFCQNTQLNFDNNNSLAPKYLDSSCISENVQTTVSEKQGSRDCVQGEKISAGNIELGASCKESCRVSKTCEGSLALLCEAYSDETSPNEMEDCKIVDGKEDKSQTKEDSTAATSSQPNSDLSRSTNSSVTSKAKQCLELDSNLFEQYLDSKWTASYCKSNDTIPEKDAESNNSDKTSGEQQYTLDTVSPDEKSDKTKNEKEIEHRCSSKYATSDNNSLDGRITESELDYNDSDVLEIDSVKGSETPVPNNKTGVLKTKTQISNLSDNPDTDNKLTSPIVRSEGELSSDNGVDVFEMKDGEQKVKKKQIQNSVEKEEINTEKAAQSVQEELDLENRSYKSEGEISSSLSDLSKTDLKENLEKENEQNEIYTGISKDSNSENKDELCRDEEFKSDDSFENGNRIVPKITSRATPHSKQRMKLLKKAISQDTLLKMSAKTRGIIEDQETCSQESEIYCQLHKQVKETASKVCKLCYTDQWIQENFNAKESIKGNKSTEDKFTSKLAIEKCTPIINFETIHSKDEETDDSSKIPEIDSFNSTSELKANRNASEEVRDSKKEFTPVGNDSVIKTSSLPESVAAMIEDAKAASLSSAMSDDEKSSKSEKHYRKRDLKTSTDDSDEADKMSTNQRRGHISKKRHLNRSSSCSSTNSSHYSRTDSDGNKHSRKHRKRFFSGYDSKSSNYSSSDRSLTRKSPAGNKEGIFVKHQSRWTKHQFNKRFKEKRQRHRSDNTYIRSRNTSEDSKSKGSWNSRNSESENRRRRHSDYGSSQSNKASDNERQSSPQVNRILMNLENSFQKEGGKRLYRSESDSSTSSCGNFRRHRPRHRQKQPRLELSHTSRESDSGSLSSTWNQRIVRMIQPTSKKLQRSYGTSLLPNIIISAKSNEDTISFDDELNKKRRELDNIYYGCTEHQVVEGGMKNRVQGVKPEADWMSREKVVYIRTNQLQTIEIGKCLMVGFH